MDARRCRGDFRGCGPRFSGANLAHNLALVETLREVARSMGVSVAQLAIAWVSSRGNDIVPLVGARKRARLDESLGAMNVTLNRQDLGRIEAAVPEGAAAGERYPLAMMATLDSERTPDRE